MSSASRPRPRSVHAWAPAGAWPPVRSTIIGSPCRTTSCGRSGTVPTMPRWQTTGRDRGHRALHHAAPARAAAGGRSRTTTWSASMTPLLGAHPGDPSAGELEVEGGGGEQHGHAARLQARGQRVGERAHPAGDRPGAEVLLDVGPHAHPGGHVAQVVTLERHRVARDQTRSRSSLNAFWVSLCRVSRVESRALVCLLACSAEKGRSSQSRRSASQSSANASTYAAQLRAQPLLRAQSIASIWAAAAATGQVELGAVLEDVCGRPARPGPARPPSPAARPDLRNRSRSTAGSSVCVGPESQRNPSCSTIADRPTEPWSRLEQGHVVAVLGQPGGARQPAVPPADHHHACHGGHPTGAAPQPGPPRRRASPGPARRRWCRRRR